VTRVRRLDGKVAVITGGAGGLGSAICRAFTAEGALVVVAGRSLDRAQALATQLGDRATAIAFDAREPETIASLMDQTVQRHERLDVLVNNAALASRNVDFRDRTAVDTPVDVWDLVLSVNLRGYFLGCKHAIPHMTRTGGGSIVNVASTSAYVGDAIRIAYAASKAAVMSLTRSVAAQHGRQGIRANTLVPGLIPTAELREHNPDLIKGVEPHLLVDRFGTPEDIAAMAVYLAGDESGYVTAQDFRVDGGLLSGIPFLPMTRGRSDVRA
jgi:NAD(P)-dependent dehydrogenase (short-subunit alcohol dehydrogenase family)